MSRKGVSVCLVMGLILGSIVVLDITMEITPRVEAITIYVDDSGGQDYTTIQAAIDYASDGDTIFVYNGTYYERLFINKAINLIGEDRENTTINGSGTGIVVFIAANWANISGFKIIDGDDGIYSSMTINNNILDNIILNQSRYGINLHLSSSCLVKGNNISSNGEYGLRFFSSSNNIIINNNFINDGILIIGSKLSDFNSHNISSNNTVNGNPIFYYKDKSGFTINKMPVGQLILANCTDFNVHDLTINNTAVGIQGAYSTNITLSNCILSGNMNSIYLYRSSENTIIGNNVTFNRGDSVYMFISPDNNIINNSIGYNLGNAMAILVGSNYNNVSGNTIINNGFGINLYASSNINFTANNFTNNGIFIHGDDLSSFNTHHIPTNNTVNQKPIYYHKDTGGLNIDGIPMGQLIIVNCEYINATNLNISHTDVGIEVAYSTNNIIINNNISANKRDGMYLFSSSNNDITNNMVCNNQNGIYHLSSWDNNIISNNVSLSDFDGIYLESSSGTRISDNNVSFNNEGGIAIQWSSINNIFNNIATSNGWSGISLDWSNRNNITGNNATLNGVGIENHISDKNIIQNNTVIWNDRGIALFGSEYINVIYNLVINNTYAIRIMSSHDINITNNLVYNNTYGIRLMTSHYISIKDNNISFNIEFGLEVESSGDNNISRNNIISNGNEGIEFYRAYDNNVNDNNISYNSVGVEIRWSSSKNNNITCNNFSHNGFGIFISDSSNNRIYHNSFIGNTNQASDNTNDGNKWDNGYPSGGNFWSDYIGNDNFKGPNQDMPGSDGIGDTNYTIDFNSVDNYPLMKPFTSQPYENYSILKQGWNLISIPILQQDQALNKVLEMINSYYDAVQWYYIADNGDSWKHHKVGKSFGNDLTHLNESMGFWIHITNPGDTIFLYNGTQPTVNQSIPLHPGWNMVGYPSLSNRTRDNGLNNINYGSDVDAIWTFNAAAQTWQEIGPTDSFELGRGYWIHSKVTKVWDVPL